MARRITVTLLSSLLVLGSQGAVMAQDAVTDEPMWPAASKKGAADVIAMGDGFLAVGANDKPALGKVWDSADGQNWKRQEGGDGFKGATMMRAEAFGDGAVALGQEGRRLVSWYSADGSDWLRNSVDKADKGFQLWPDDVTAGPTGLLAVASLIGQDIAGQRFYHSPDGQDWSTVETPPETAGIFTSLAATADEYLAVARAAFGPGEDLYWRSPDGLTWETFAGPSDGWLHDIAVGEDGSFVAAGALQETESTLRPAIWRAMELGEWDLVYTYPSAKQTEDRLHFVDAAGSGFVAMGTISECPAQPNRTCLVASVLASADGLEWQPLAIDDGMPGPLHDTEVTSVASDGTTTVMLARHEGRPNELWTASVP